MRSCMFVTASSSRTLIGTRHFAVDASHVCEPDNVRFDNALPSCPIFEPHFIIYPCARLIDPDGSLHHPRDRRRRAKG